MIFEQGIHTPKKRKLRPREPIHVSPLCLSQLNCEALVGVNSRRFADLLRANPSCPRSQVGRLTLVRVDDFLKLLESLAPAEPMTDASPSSDDDGHPTTVDEVLARLGRRRAS